MNIRLNTKKSFGQKAQQQNLAFTVQRNIKYMQIPDTSLYAFKIEYTSRPALTDKKYALNSQQGVATKKNLLTFLNNEAKEIKTENIVVTTSKTRENSRKQGSDANNEIKTKKLFDHLSSGKITADDLYSYNDSTDEYTQILTKKVLARPITFDYGYFNNSNYDLKKLQAELYVFSETNNWKLESSALPTPHWSDVPASVYLAITINPTDEQMTHFMEKAKKESKRIEDVVANILYKNMKTSKLSAKMSKKLTDAYHESSHAMI